jgi:hypothetical protein
VATRVHIQICYSSGDRSSDEHLQHAGLAVKSGLINDLPGQKHFL